MDGRVILRLISEKSERRVWNWIQAAQNRDVQRVFVNTRVIYIYIYIYIFKEPT